jgi:group I intron endonuclease
VVFTLYMYAHKDSEKRYIGITNNIERRRGQHARGCHGAGLFSRAVKAHGIDAFEFITLGVYDNFDAAAQMEQMAINVLGTLYPYGYNLNAGAPYTRYCGPHSTEQRRKMSESMKGLKRSPEACANISKAKKGRRHTPEECKNISDGQRGKKHSPEWCKSISDGKKGKKRPPFSEEWIRNISDAQKRRPPMSLETRNKISETLKRRYSHERPVNE